MEVIASRYAETLFDLAQEEKSIEKYATDMQLVNEVLSSNPTFVQFFNHVLINDKDKIDLIDKSFKGQIDEYVLNFLKLLITKRRIKYILDICKAFKGLCNECFGIEEGILYTSIDLDAQQIKRIEQAVSTKENKTVNLQVIKDESLIGGIKVVLDNRVIDGSIKNKVELLKRELLRR